VITNVLSEFMTERQSILSYRWPATLLRAQLCNIAAGMKQLRGLMRHSVTQFLIEGLVGIDTPLPAKHPLNAPSAGLPHLRGRLWVL